MDHRPLDLDDKGRLTLRVPVGGVALVVALVAHVLVVVVVSRLPEPERPPDRLQITLSPTPSPAGAATTDPPPEVRAPAPARQRVTQTKPKVPASPTPSSSPVAPELVPSDDPSETRARLPEVVTSPEPTPPPAPSTWEERLRAQLAATTPRPPRSATGVLAPSAGSLHEVVARDPRLHDEQTERRLAADFGPFFRRGLDALRGNWHPDEVLRETERDRARRCGRKTRTTYAVAVLDKRGHVIEVDLKEPSGCPGLDEEAVAAFLRVAQFPHPPAGIFVAPDGSPMDTARYPVRFIVTFDGGLHLDWQ